MLLESTESELLPSAFICKYTCQLNSYDMRKLTHLVKNYLNENCTSFCNIQNLYQMQWEQLRNLVGHKTDMNIMEESNLAFEQYLDMLCAFYLTLGKQIAIWGYQDILVTSEQIERYQKNYQAFLCTEAVREQREKAQNTLYKAYQLFENPKDTHDIWFQCLELQCVCSEAMHNHCVIAGYEAETLWLMNAGIPPINGLTLFVHQKFDECKLHYNAGEYGDFVTELMTLCII